MIVLHKRSVLCASIIVLSFIIMSAGIPFYFYSSSASNTTIINSVETQEDVINQGPMNTRVDKPTGSGPYSTTYIFDYIPRFNDTYVPARIYYPTSGGGVVDPNGAPYNGIVFAPGAGGTETSYFNTLSTIASWGFIVTIVGTGGPCNQEVVDIQSYVIDYYEELNANSSSTFYNKINTTACGASGHSNGGWTAIAGAVADDRFQAVCTLAAAAGPYYESGQANTGNLNVPLQLVAGADDHTYLPSSDAYYQLANPIKSYIKIAGSGHGGPFNLEYLVSFYKFWLNGKDEYATFIYGDELQNDIQDNEIEFSSDVGLNPYPEISKTIVYEDEMITFTSDGYIVKPESPDRVIIRFEWDFDLDGNYDWNSSEKESTTNFYELNGEYNVRFKVTDSWGLTASHDYAIIVQNKKPVGDAGNDTTSIEDEMLYFNASHSTDTNSDLSSLLFQWDFGDKNWTSWDFLPTSSHNYSQEGEYTARVYVKDDDGAMGGDSITVTVTNVVPKANFSIDKTSAHVNEIIYFNAAPTWDTPSDISSLSYLWDFDDSDLAEGNVTEHSYDDEGEYIVTLTVEDNNDATSISTKIITILNSPPTCQAMDEIEINEDEIVEFSGTGSDTKSDEKKLQYSWDLGIPGRNITQWNSTADLEFKYTKAGVYNATLFVKDDNDEIGIDIVKITVLNSKPIAKFATSSSKVFEDEEIKFDASGSVDTESDLEFLNYSWSLDHGSSNRFGKTISHSYNSRGEYTVWLTVTDDNGAFDTFSRKIVVSNVNPSVKMNVSNSSVLPGEKIIFSANQIQDSSSDLDSLTFTWDFGDNTKGTGKLVSHRYSKAGRYAVILTVKDDDGATGLEETTITIKEIVPEDGKDETDKEVVNMSIFIIPIILVIIIILILVFIFMIRKKRASDEEIQPEPAQVTIPMAQGTAPSPMPTPMPTPMPMPILQSPQIIDSGMVVGVQPVTGTQLKLQQQPPIDTYNQYPQDQYLNQQNMSMQPQLNEPQSQQFDQLPPAGTPEVESSETVVEPAITPDHNDQQDTQPLPEQNQPENETPKDSSTQLPTQDQSEPIKESDQKVE